MAISTTTSRKNYTGNGTASVFAYSFRILSDDHLLVTVQDSTGTETTLNKTTDYTVSGVGSDSGSITLVNASQAWLTGGNLSTGYTMSIVRNVPLTQPTDIRNQGEFYPETHENALDRVVMQNQQQQDAIDRGVRLPVTVDPSTFDPEVPAAIVGEAGAVLKVNDNGDGWTVGSASLTGTTVTPFMETVLDDLSASAARTTLGIDGISGNIATGDLAAGSVTEEKLSTNAVTTAKILDANVTEAKLATNAVTTTKITDANVTPAKMASNGIQVMVSTGAGHGSINTKIRRIETAVVSAGGSDITTTHSATDGTSFTINTPGLYALTYEDTISVGDIGISVNSNQLTTSIASITASHRVAFASAAVDTTAAITAIRWLTAGDVVRPHTNGVAASVAATVSFTITRIL